VLLSCEWSKPGQDKKAQRGAGLRSAYSTSVRFDASAEFGFRNRIGVVHPLFAEIAQSAEHQLRLLKTEVRFLHLAPYPRGYERRIVTAYPIDVWKRGALRREASGASKSIVASSPVDRRAGYAASQRVTHSILFGPADECLDPLHSILFCDRPRRQARSSAKATTPGRSTVVREVLATPIARRNAPWFRGRARACVPTNTPARRPGLLETTPAHRLLTKSSA
jgi:hypothetical protein